MKKWVSLFLAFAMLFALSLPVFAAESEAQEAAQTLHELGLFKGTGTNAAGKPVFDLNRAPTRAEAVTMLARLLGKEDEALAGDWNTPFIDVADWAKPYVGLRRCSISLTYREMKSPKVMPRLPVDWLIKSRSHCRASFLVAKPRFFLWMVLPVQSVTRIWDIQRPVSPSFVTDIFYLLPSRIRL